MAIAPRAQAGSPSAYSAQDAPADSLSSYRAAYHFTVPDNWKNDPQRPIFINGKYQYYYLYNGNYNSGGGGTAWRMASSTDLVSFQDEGIAIPKFTTPNADIWSGSAVVDTNNTAGFGAGAVVAFGTQPDAGGGNAQAQFLWYSTNGGDTFTPYSNAPVVANPGVADFRDPKVEWDPVRSRWVMVVAMGERIRVFTSTNLRAWTFRSDFDPPNLGFLECPDLFQMRAADGTLHWVLGVSATGPGGSPFSFAYYTGAFDGNVFVPDTSAHQWLDHGYDWYGAVTWANAASSDQSIRYAMAWLNNWAYPDNTPTRASDGFNGTDSIVREIRLVRRSNGTYGFNSAPVNLDSVARSTATVPTTTVDGKTVLPNTGQAFELTADVSWTTATNVGLELRRSTDGARHVDVGVYTPGSYSYVSRRNTSQPDTSNTRLESQAPFDSARKSVKLRILVDRTSVEVFVDDGQYVHSDQMFAPLADQGIALYSSGGAATFTNMRIRQLNYSSGPSTAPTGGAIRSAVDASKCLDRDGGSGRAQIWSCTGGSNQTWEFNTNGTITTGGSCLTLPSGQTGNGTLVSAGACNGTAAQHWTRSTNGSLRNEAAARCLDRPSGDHSNGRQVQIWDCNGGANQTWAVQ